MSVGFEHLDVDLLRNKGIKIGYTPDVLTDATADLTFSLVLLITRRLGEVTKLANLNRQ